ncbi:MAG: hypothetical protein MN733_42165, partial [Nitrososphaera sp.]|nr:hypothetical protein [Nitrososphaera sp.]
MSKQTMLTYLVCVLLLFGLSLSCNLLEAENDDRNWTNGKQLPPPDESGIPDSVKNAYWQDAAQLALRDVYNDEESKKSLIEIPDELIQLYYDGLLHIYQATSIPERDSVAQIFKIHAFPSPELYSLLVAVDSTKEWTKAWRNGNRLTGNPQIDELMEQYELELERYYHWPWSHTAVLLSPKPLNILALAQPFATIDGVGYAEPNGRCYDGNDITASVEPGFVTYLFSVGYGDCPAGCISRRFWEFTVGYN